VSQSDAAPKQDTGLPPPAENPDLFGHEAAERAVLEAWSSGRMPHAWLIAGPAGIGKATLAYRIAKFVLCGGEATGEAGLFGAKTAPPTSLRVDPDAPAARQVATGSHPDLRILRRTETKSGTLSNVVRIEDVRGFVDRVRLKPSAGGWRVAIVDEAERMNRNAENALLKVLEEPPKKTLILIVTGNMSAMLPTTRSRCRRLSLGPLADNVVRDLLARSGAVGNPGDVEMLVRLAQGSIGRALALVAAGGPELQRDIDRLLDPLPRVDGEALHAFAGKVSRRSKEGEIDAFETATGLMVEWIETAIRSAAGAEADAARPGAGWVRAIGVEEAFRRRGAFGRLVRLESALNLDRKQVMLDGVHALAGQET